jgi:hypothetical protein
MRSRQTQEKKLVSHSNKSHGDEGTMKVTAPPQVQEKLQQVLNVMLSSTA